VLNTTYQNLNFPVSTVYYDKKQVTEIPFGNQSFDFMVCRDRVFKNPFAMVNECMRVAKKGGVIQMASPLETLLSENKYPYVIWPDRYSHSLCIIPYHKVFIPNRTKWLDLINYNPIYLNCFYHWDNPMDINIKTFTNQDEEIYENDYVKFITEILHESVSHTQEFLTQNQD
jgi:ubiquinone/menaquinone biosynthesis C-methylase UbiE